MVDVDVGSLVTVNLLVDTDPLRCAIRGALMVIGTCSIEVRTGRRFNAVLVFLMMHVWLGCCFLSAVQKLTEAWTLDIRLVRVACTVALAVDRLVVPTAGYAIGRSSPYCLVLLLLTSRRLVSPVATLRLFWDRT